jgi:hypothetical protein
MEEPRSRPVWNAAVEERRQSTRFPKERGADSAVIWQHPGREKLVDVYDESLHGICLVLADLETLKIGSKATIVYHSNVLDAIVRRITPQPDGTFLVGFECE